MTDVATETFQQWAILELMGRRCLAGRVTEADRFGTKMLRIDIPPSEPEGQVLTQFYGGSAIYCLTPVDEETARALAGDHRGTPVDPWSARRMLEIEDRSQTANEPLQIDEVAFLGEDS